MKFIFTSFVVLFLTVSHAFGDSSNSCLQRRQRFFSGYVNPGDTFSAHTVLNNFAQKILCEDDVKKILQIAYTTFRISIVDKNNDIVDGSEITGTLTDATHILTVGVFDNSNPWNENLKKSSFNIKLENMAGEQVDVKVVSVRQKIALNCRENALLLTLANNPVLLNPELASESNIGIPSKIITRYPLATTGFLNVENNNKQKLEVTGLKRNLLLFAYEMGRDVWLWKDLKVSFGLTDFAYQDNSLGGPYRVIATAVSKTNVGGGVYDDHFNLVGLQYGTQEYINNGVIKNEALINFIPYGLFPVSTPSYSQSLKRTRP